MNKPVDRLYAGTSGYSYAEWVAAGVYPAGTHAADMLPAYAEMSKATKFNYTCYQMPKARALERMAAQVPRGFKFSVKITRTMTHEVEKTGWIREVYLFLLDNGHLYLLFSQVENEWGATTITVSQACRL